MRDIAASYHDAELRQRVRQVDDMVFAPAASSGMPRSGSFQADSDKIAALLKGVDLNPLSRTATLDEAKAKFGRRGRSRS